jgi:hypothetical protein
MMVRPASSELKGSWMEKYDHIFIDFDRTIFDHHKYIHWLDGFFTSRFGVESGAFNDTLRHHHKTLPENMHLYEHVAHFETLSGRSWSYVSGEIERVIAAEGQDFCFDDSHKTIQKLTDNHQDVRILTYGKGDYQRFKLNTCRFLRNHSVPIHVVREPKRLFLSNEFPKSTGVLVDDKYPLNLPAKWLHVWIVRTENLDAPEQLSSGEIKISSLNQLQTAIST